MIPTTVRQWMRSRIVLVTFCALLVGSFILFSWLKQEPVFFDGDPFYHAKVAQLMIERGNIIKEFPWMPGSILEQTYIDHHFLYHAVLIPFILATGDPLVAIRIASIFFASMLIACFYLFLRSCSVRLPLLYTLILFASQSFITRVNLDRAPAASLLVLLLWLYALMRKKHTLLFCVSFFYVWFYNAWPLAFVASFLWCTTNAAIHNRLFDVRMYASFAVCTSGLLTGIIINPYFPVNIIFFKTLFLSIVIFTQGVAFGIGEEWFPASPLSFIQSNIMFGILYLCAVSWSLACIMRSRNAISSSLSHTVLFFGSFSILLFLATVKSQRMAEYFIPIGTCFIALSLSDLLPRRSLFKEAAARIAGTQFIPLKIVGSMACMVAFTYMLVMHIEAYQSLYAYTTHHTRFSFRSMQNLGEYMKRAVPTNSIVATNDWSFFSQLFYYADHYRYLWGLDPTLTHDMNPKRYDTLYSLMARNTGGESAAEILRTEFNASYLIIAKQDGAPQGVFPAAIAKNKSFKKLYEDEDALLYAIP